MQEESIKVVLRMRPPNKQINHFVKEHNSISIVDEKKYSQMNKNYYFDNVYDKTASSFEIYTTFIQNIIEQSILQQVNSTIFTYGCTGSGKTFTMFGDSNSENIYNREGILMMSLRQIVLKRIEFQSFGQIFCSCIEIYNEQVHDLFANQEDTNNYLTIYQDEQKRQFNVSGVKQISINNIQEAIQVINTGQKNRRYAETVRNRMSSRSHIVFRVNLRNSQGRKIYINFVDLAGSQKLIKQKNAQRINQSKNINKSLFFLTQVVYTLTKQSYDPFVPYRNSTLTKILKSSLGGNSRTCMILCIDPSQYQNSLSTIRFGCQAKQIKNKIQSQKNGSINQNTIEKQEYLQLKKDLEQYKIKYNDLEKTYNQKLYFYQQEIRILNNKLLQKDKLIENTKFHNKQLNFLEISQNINNSSKSDILEKKLNKQIKKIQTMKSIIHQQNYVRQKLSKIVLLYHNSYNWGLQKLNQVKINQINDNIEKLKKNLHSIKQNSNLKNRNFEQKYHVQSKPIQQILQYYPEQFYNIPFLASYRPQNI